MSCLYDIILTIRKLRDYRTVMHPNVNKFILGLFAFGVVFCLVISAVLFFSYAEIENKRALLDEKGIETNATIVHKEKSYISSLLVPNQSSSDNKHTSDYLLHLRFDANSSKGTLSFNKALKGEKQDFDLTFDYKKIIVSVTASEYKKAKISGKIKIKYLSDDPSVYQYLNAKGEYRPNYNLYYALGVLLAAVFCAVSVRQYYRTGTTW